MGERPSVAVQEPDWRTDNPSDGVEFITEPEHYGVIPEPEPAYKFMPDWYKQLPLELDGGVERSGIGNSTVRACIPFLEAMKQGYVLKTPCEISLSVTDDYQFEYEWRMDTEEGVMTHFDKSRIGDAFPGDGPILKFHTLWKMRVPDGYSTLQMPLMNRRDEDRFRPFCGFLDTDSYMQTMNSIVEWTGGEYQGVIEKGTPVAQVIPIKRENLLTDALARPMTEDEVTEMERQSNQIMGDQRFYRTELWDPVDATRVKHDDSKDT